MKNTKTTKQAQIDSLKRKKRWLLTTIILLAVFVLYLSISYVLPSILEDSAELKEILATNQTYEEEACTSSDAYLWSKGFFDSLFSDNDFSVVRKILVFFGVVYLIQLLIIGVFEAIEIVFLFYAIIKRVFKWARKKKIET